MQKIEETGRQFASLFGEEALKPYLHQLWERMAEGHICLPISEVSLDGLPYNELAPPSKLPQFSQLITTNPNEIRPFVLHNAKLYLQRYFNYETSILKSMERMLLIAPLELQKREAELLQMKSFLESLNATYNLSDCLEDEKTDWQMVAALLGFLNNFTIITGGPGTGKTTTVAKILALLYTANPQTRVALAAPTGKAAVRMAESLKNSASQFSQNIREKFSSLHPNTIHRLLQSKNESLYFKHNASHPVPYDVVVVDEASMIDASLFSKLLDAIASGTRIILLGDRNQLASVEVGSLLGDFCKSLPQMNRFSSRLTSFVNRFITDPQRQVPLATAVQLSHPLQGNVVELRKSHRFTGSGGIGQLSRLVIEGNRSGLEQLMLSGTVDQVKIDLNCSNDLFEDCVEEYTAYIKENDIAAALEKMNQVKLLCAVREGEKGLHATNRKVEKFLAKKNLLLPYEEFYQNRPIIITRNMPELGLFNGDIGLLRRDSHGVMKAWFEDNEKNIRSVLPGYLSDVETVFAMTIHKSQGSEYKRVLVLLPDEENNPLLTRELLYTAITRAKESLLLQTQENVLWRTVSQQVKRISGISERFGEMNLPSLQQ